MVSRSSIHWRQWALFDWAGDFFRTHDVIKAADRADYLDPDGPWDPVVYPEWWAWREERGLPQEPPADLPASTTRCPRCWSTRVTIGYPVIKCDDCGYTEELIDFPISRSYHRALSIQYGGPDPGEA